MYNGVRIRFDNRQHPVYAPKRTDTLGGCYPHLMASLLRRRINVPHAFPTQIFYPEFAILFLAIPLGSLIGQFLLHGDTSIATAAFLFQLQQTPRRLLIRSPHVPTHLVLSPALSSSRSVLLFANFPSAMNKETFKVMLFVGAFCSKAGEGK